MSAVQTGWIKNEDGEKFAPKTLASQVMTSNGESIDTKILPTVTDEDNDKFLVVQEGKWTTVSIPLARGVRF